VRLTSETFHDNGTMPDDCAFGVLGPDKNYVWGKNMNPHLRWWDLPRGTRSLVLINDDLDVPVKLDTFNKEGATVSKSLARRTLCHWVLVDLAPDGPPIAVGEFSKGVTIGGKPGPEAPRGTRQGVNAYGPWFKANDKMRGDYYGYDGPCPPWNDEIPHRYVFTMYALDVPRLAVEGKFDKDAVLTAMRTAKVLGEASVTGLYALNPGLRTK
jgi:Raf kinase inhibitor-like YbhB/YbcL family protein